MKIVITVEKFDPNKGYLEYYLSRELTKRGHKVYVFTFGWRNRVSKLNEGFEVVSVPHIAITNGIHVPSFGGVIYTTKFIKATKPDIIHCQPLYSPISLLFISCQKLSRYGIVGSLVTGKYSVNSTIKKLKHIIVKMLTERYVENKVDLFFAINNGWKKVLLQLFSIPHQKISILPLGADPELFKFDDKTRTQIRSILGLSSHDVVVVYSGKIIPSKELHVLVKAIAPIIVQNRYVKLLIVGKGDPSYTGKIKELCSNLKISNNVIFHSWVHRTKLPEFYSASDIAVWPGSVSISIIEAASVGLPVIIKRSPITKYATAYDNGFAFERGDIDELHKYLKILIHNEKLRQEMGRKSRLLVEQKLNWRTIVDQYLSLFYHSIAVSTETRARARANINIPESPMPQEQSFKTWY